MKAHYISSASLSTDASAQSIVRVLNPLDPNRAIDTHHQLMWSLFAGSNGTEKVERDFLWREDNGQFIILSERPPADPHSLFNISTRRFDPGMRVGDSFLFRLRVNATICKATKDQRKPSKRRHDVVMNQLRRLEHEHPEKERHELRDLAIEEAANCWMSSTALRAGFKLNSIETATYKTIKLPRKGNQIASFGILNLDGALSITDPELLLRSVYQGFGRSKAFGCGLMLLRAIA